MSALSGNGCLLPCRKGFRNRQFVPTARCYQARLVKTRRVPARREFFLVPVIPCYRYLFHRRATGNSSTTSLSSASVRSLQSTSRSSTAASIPLTGPIEEARPDLPTGKEGAWATWPSLDMIRSVCLSNARRCHGRVVAFWSSRHKVRAFFIA
jgi:hypothetical protein